MWAVLAALHPVDGKNHPNRLYHCKPYENELNTTGLTYPLPLSQVSKFETLNPNISVSVLVYEERQLIPLYTSPHPDRKHTIHLLLLSVGAKHHYTTVQNLSRLVCGRTEFHGQTHVCPYCLHCFREEHSLTDHIEHCKKHQPQVVSYPNPKRKEDTALSYKDIRYEFPVQYVLYVDFESFLRPSEDDENVVSDHVPSGFCCLKVSKFDDEIFLPYT